MVYSGLIESLLSFNIVTWHGNITVNNKARLTRIVNTASKLVGHDQRQLSSLHSVALKRKATQVLSDPDHPLNTTFEMFPSGRRFKVPLAKEIVYDLFKIFRLLLQCRFR